MMIRAVARSILVLSLLGGVAAAAPASKTTSASVTKQKKHHKAKVKKARTAPHKKTHRTHKQ